MFQLSHVTKSYGGEDALRDVTLEIGSGMNYIVGPSGSGKSTLLKIMSGLDGSFEGSVSFEGQDLSHLSGSERARLYGQAFGFVWQDFNLLEDRTVRENVMLSSYLSQETDERAIMKTLREMKIDGLADHRVSELSGGQKQRVAIARELVKDPEVIFADEPTSALDRRSAKSTMAILRVLAKKCCVIVVTHDRSLLVGSSQVFELDKGTLASSPKPKRAARPAAAADRRRPRLTIAGALHLGAVAVRRNLGHTLSLALAVLLSASLLVATGGSSVASAGQSEFDNLYASYGDQLLDISLFSEFIGAGQNNGKKSDDPDVNVKQDVSGLFEKYAHDKRVAAVLVPQAFLDIHIIADGKDHAITSSNNVPIMNKLLAGSMPTGDGDEIAVPDSLVKKLGWSNKQAIGKEIDFKASVNNWSSGTLKTTPVSAHAKITGVFNADMMTEMDGGVSKVPIDDSFFFSPGALKRIRSAAGLSAKSTALYLRAKTPAAMISLKNELNAAGIVPTGHFELVEKLVKMNKETTEQSGSATVIIAGLSVVVVAAVALIGAVLRRREFAIFKVSGYLGRRMAGVIAGEFALLALISAAFFLLASPITAMVVEALWKVSLMRADLIGSGMIISAAAMLVAGLITLAVAGCTRPVAAMHRGDR